jgi:SAM-dependent methyltransferase
MLHDKPFDRRLRRVRRDRSTSPGADYLHQRAAEELLERLDCVKRSFASALVMGSEAAAAGLRQRGIAVTVADPAYAAAARSGGVQCDEDMLPFADASFDLIVSIGLLDSVNDLPGALTLFRRALRPDGLFLAAFAGAGSLPRLRSAMLAGDQAVGETVGARIHPQIDVRAAGDLLTRTGFFLPVADSEDVTVRFGSLASLLADLRAMGVTNMIANRSTRPLGRTALLAAAADFTAHADADGKTGERFEIIYLTAWSAPADPAGAMRRPSPPSFSSTLPRPG